MKRGAVLATVVAAAVLEACTPTAQIPVEIAPPQPEPAPIVQEGEESDAICFNAPESSVYEPLRALVQAAAPGQGVELETQLAELDICYVHHDPRAAMPEFRSPPGEDLPSRNDFCNLSTVREVDGVDWQGAEGVWNIYECTERPSTAPPGALDLPDICGSDFDTATGLIILMAASMDYAHPPYARSEVRRTVRELQHRCPGRSDDIPEFLRDIPPPNRKSVQYR